MTSADTLSDALVLVASRAVRPIRMELPGKARDRHPDLVRWFGTGDIAFEAPQISLTFSRDDAEALLPRADPVLAAFLSDYADQMLATARPVWGWLDSFKTELSRLWDDGPPTLTSHARHFGYSPRTLQRRLHDAGTSWREQVEAMRQDQTDRLLRSTPPLILRGVMRPLCGGCGPVGDGARGPNLTSPPARSESNRHGCEPNA